MNVEGMKSFVLSNHYRINFKRKRVSVFFSLILIFKDLTTRQRFLNFRHFSAL